MNKKLINYYNKELRYLREKGYEFAEQYPKIASRLNLNDNETPDPYVERLLEGIAFLTARTQLKIDSEYPRFVQRILEVVYPQFLNPIPASTIVKFDSTNKHNINVLNKIARGHVLESLPIKINNQNVTCKFSVTQDTEISPLVLESSSYTNSLDYLPKTYNSTRLKTRSALRLDFALTSSGNLSDLTPNNLILFLGANLPVSSQLLFLLTSSCQTAICHNFEDSRNWHYELPDKPIQCGFKNDESLTFNLNKSIRSLRIVQEYIQLPEKFLFVKVKGIDDALRKAESDTKIANTPHQVETVVADSGINKRVVSYNKRKFSVSFLFKDYVPDLAQLMKENDISINTCPLVNLFKKRSVRFPVNMENLEHHVIVDRVEPLSFEVHSIERIKGYDKYNNQQVIFTPIYKAKDQGVFINSERENAFFSVRREARSPSVNVLKNGGRTSYLGSEVYLSMMNESQKVVDFDIDHLSVEAWCTNRDLPLILTRSKESDFLINSGLSIDSVHIISEVTKPVNAVDEHQTLWSLLNQLNLSYSSYFDKSAKDKALMIKELLLAFPHEYKGFYESEVNSITHFEIEPVKRIERYRGAGSVRKGVSIKIIFDENSMAGIHPILFGSILRYYFACSLSINSYLEMSIETVQHGKIIEWNESLEGEKTLI